MVRVAVFVSFFTIFVCNTQLRMCSAEEMVTNANVSRQDDRDHVTLPTPELVVRKEVTDCCSNSNTTCCKTSEKGFFRISDTMAMAIAISVTSACTAVTVVVIVCCFSSRCPLYSVCRVRYTRSEIASFTKCTDSTNLNNMPLESSKKSKLSFSNMKSKNIGSAV